MTAPKGDDMRALWAVSELSNRLATVAPRGSQPAFTARQILNLYTGDYSRAFACSTIPYPLIQQVALRLPCPHAEACRQMVGLTTFPCLPTLQR